MTDQENGLGMDGDADLHPKELTKDEMVAAVEAYRSRGIEEIAPTGRTVDGEVEPVVLDLAALDTTGQEDNLLPSIRTELGQAIAAHFGIEPEQITGFVVTCEFETPAVGETPGGTTLSSAWSLGVPAWRLRSFAVELIEHLKGA